MNNGGVNRDQQKLLFVLGLITNANRAAMILAWIDKKEWGGAKSHKEDGLTAHEKYEKRHVQSKKKKQQDLVRNRRREPKKYKKEICFIFIY